MITQRLQRYSTDNLATEATEDSHMYIDLDTTSDQHQLQDIINKQTLGGIKHLRQ